MQQFIILLNSLWAPTPASTPFSICLLGWLGNHQLLYGHYAFKTRGHDLSLAELVTATTRKPKTEN